MNDGDIKGVILHNLLKNESYSRKVVPFIKIEYFKDRRERILFESIQEFILKYNNLPTKEVLHIVLEKKETINESEHQLILDLLEELYKHQETVDSEWLLDETEKFCKESAVYNAIMESINIIDGNSKTDSGSIPDILSKALAVSFDKSVGHDYLENADDRFDFYKRVEEKIPFDIDKLCFLLYK